MHDIFPTTNAHIVIGPAGAAPNFVRSLIENLYFDNLLEISEVGDSHNSRISRNWYRPDIDVKEHGLIIHDVKNHELTVNPLDPNKPLILMSHNIHLDCNLFYSKYPLGKLVVITVNNPKSYYRVQANFFIKALFAHVKYNKPWAMTAFSQLNKKYKFLKDKLNTANITNDELKLLVTDTESVNGLKLFYSYNPYFYKYKDKILYVDYTDLLEKKDEILDKLSNFIGRPINQNTITSYNTYLEKQVEVINKYAPWIVDYENSFSPQS